MFWDQKHPVSDEQLSAYADGRVPPAERVELESHIGSCVACREGVAELQSLRQALSSLPRASAPRSFALREADVHPPERAPSGSFAAAMPMLGGVTMVAFLAFGVMMGMDMTGGSSNTSNEKGAGPQAALSSDNAAEGSPATSAQPPTGTDYQGFTDDRVLTATAASLRGNFAVPVATPPVARPAAGTDGKDDGNSALRFAEIAAAAVGLVTASSWAAVWWRRRT